MDLKKKWKIVVIGIGVVAAISLVAAHPLLGIHTVSAAKSPLPLPTNGFSHEVFDRVVWAVVKGDRVDYAGLQKKHAVDLHRYAATLATAGPQKTPRRFVDRPQRLAYYLNAYNALVLLAVLHNWPIGSVRDVRGPIEPRAGFGFFWAQRFIVDGESTNLHDLENEIIRERFGDARIHAAINCASRSCPALSGRAFDPRVLSRQLDDAARTFASHPRHVRIDDANKAIVLSAIYDWFRSDFEMHAKKIGAGAALLDWIGHYADDGTKATLKRARKRSYRVRFADYDWRINGIDTRP